MTSADLHNNLGNVYKDQGRLDDAITQYRKSLTIKMQPAVFSNLIYTLHYHPDYSAAAIYRELERYDGVFGEPLRQNIRPYLNDRTPGRKLRLGYISSEFRQHALGLNLIPLFANHDKSQFELYVYSQVDKPDFYTYRFRQIADHWHDVQKLSDDQLAGLVRRDQIDILVDLHQHMAGNRLPVYARKPAPVQIAFAGYPGSTGLKTIDFRLTDPYLEPPEAPPQPSSEAPLRLPHSFWCYHAAADVPPNELPASRNGFVTFGNFNNFCKMNHDTFELWAQIMRAVPKSRLLLLVPDGSARDRVRVYFANRGITPERVNFVSRAPISEYYRLFHRIDITLDSFPCNGHTTSMDSWWMGVPVTSKLDQRLFGRATWSQANNLGLAELVAPTDDQFVQISIALAQDLPRVASLRRSLRERMQSSPLMDDKSFAQGIENAYRHAWQQWCDGKLSL
jgi:predicted O-linked N-acetylglucosamine transferase (SPINDLY family)